MKLLGSKVYGEDGHGGSYGEIVALENTQYVGTQAIVKWTEGNSAGVSESFFPYQFKHISEKCGIGVYITEERGAK
jgi:hypothetical protein